MGDFTLIVLERLNLKSKGHHTLSATSNLLTPSLHIPLLSSPPSSPPFVGVDPVGGGAHALYQPERVIDIFLQYTVASNTNIIIIVLISEVVQGENKVRTWSSVLIGQVS